jgi:hypothetical protein
VDVAPVIVLKPWSNPADFAALCELKNNVDPQFADDIEKMLQEIEKNPGRELGSYGTECLPHITHHRVRGFAEARRKALEE